MGPVTLPTSGRVYVDTAIFIYTIERHPDYAPILRPFWLDVEAGHIQVVTSTLTLLEVLVMPLRNGDTARVQDFKDALSAPQVRFFPITHATLRLAADLRAHTRLRTPDAVHIASARRTRCTDFLTNDGRLPPVSGLNIITLPEP